MIHIDGARDEGGGQILRSALTLSLATGTPFTIDNIRAGRRKPGLMRQHLTAVKAAAEIGGARVSHDEIGSTRLVFEPGATRAGDYMFNVGSAGSTALVLQTILLPLALAGAPSRLVLRGGTHTLAAPPFEFVEQAFLPLLRRMGFVVDATLTRPGFYPAGGGEIVVAIRPPATLRPLAIATRGAWLSGKAAAIVANLPLQIAQREAAHFRKRMNWAQDAVETRAERRAQGPGNCLIVTLEHEEAREVVVAFGRIGASSECVAEEAAAATLSYLAGTHPIGGHLADQLLLPLALGAGGFFVTERPTPHTRTNIEVIEMFLRRSIDVAAQADGNWRIGVE